MRIDPPDDYWAHDRDPLTDQERRQAKLDDCDFEREPDPGDVDDCADRSVLGRFA